MTIHPRHINRRHAKQTYILDHRSDDFSGFLCGVRFRNGTSEPAIMRKALRLAGACGASIIGGLCVETGIRFGDIRQEPEPEPEPIDLEEVVGALIDRAIEIALMPEEAGPGETVRIIEILETMSIDDQAAQLDELEQSMVAAEKAHAKDGTEGPQEPASDTDEESPKGSDEAADSESSPEESIDPAFADGDPGTSDDRFRLVRAAMDQLYTKAQLDTWAQENLGRSLDTRQNKIALLDDIFGDERVEEMPESEPESEGAQVTE